MIGATTGQDDVRLQTGFPVDEFTAIVGRSVSEVSVHVFPTPLQPDGTHRFLYEHVRCARHDVFATGGSVIVRTDGTERSFHLGRDIGPLQIDLSGDLPYEDREGLVAFVRESLSDLRRDSARRNLPQLVLRQPGQREILVDARSLSVHDEGLFRLGHGWLIRWDETTTAAAPAAAGAAGDLRIYATDGRCIVVRLDLP